MIAVPVTSRQKLELSGKVPYHSSNISVLSPSLAQKENCKLVVIPGVEKFVHIKKKNKDTA